MLIRIQLPDWLALVYHLKVGIFIPDPHNLNPDPVFYFNAVPDPAFHFNADPDPAPGLARARRSPQGGYHIFIPDPDHFNPDPDPAFRKRIRNEDIPFLLMIVINILHFPKKIKIKVPAFFF